MRRRAGGLAAGGADAIVSGNALRGCANPPRPPRVSWRPGRLPLATPRRGGARARPGPPPAGRGRAAATIAASAGLLLLFAVNPENRIAFGAGMTTALLGFFATRVLSARRL